MKSLKEGGRKEDVFMCALWDLMLIYIQNYFFWPRKALK